MFKKASETKKKLKWRIIKKNQRWKFPKWNLLKESQITGIGDVMRVLSLLVLIPYCWYWSSALLVSLPKNIPYLRKQILEPKFVLLSCLASKCKFVQSHIAMATARLLMNFEDSWNQRIWKVMGRLFKYFCQARLARVHRRVGLGWTSWWFWFYDCRARHAKRLNLRQT